ncbi:glycosyltransferase [Intrasporangium sp.]|uniref:glycosyltransferase n=1 Tax=Intrasporangium sp. TaxID=1925024 RepID=UPI00293B2B0A|nr:glycosyltransferase [Intrasporangium sp.]MDV3221132.1 glycosyltransferase [Intrasporangium sp.]
MRILLLAMGSRGDVQPMLALGDRLRREGFAVSVAAAADFAGLVAEHGLDVEPLSFGIMEGVRSELGQKWLGGTSTNQQREAYLMRKVVRYVAEPLADDLIRLTDRADAFVSGPMTFEAMEALASRAAKPHVFAMFQPTWPTAQGRSATFALRPQQTSWLNRAWGWAAAYAAWDVVRSPGGVVRRRLGLPRATFRQYVAAARRVPTVLAVSPRIVPRAPEWGANLTTTGFWFAPRSSPWEPPRGLSDFLATGPPPVYLGLGSMATADPAGVVRAFVDALARLGRRGVLSAGWAGLPAEDLPDSVLAIDDVPHDALFPQMSVVIHHGGAGTTAAALRAGVPQVVVPHIADQPYWGRRVHELGVGAAPMHRKHLSADRLAAAIASASHPEVERAAVALGAGIRAEDGVGKATRVIRAALEEPAQRHTT